MGRLGCAHRHGSGMKGLCYRVRIRRTKQRLELTLEDVTSRTHDGDGHRPVGKPFLQCSELSRIAVNLEA